MSDFEQIEFHRTGYGLLPEAGDKDSGMAVCFPRTRNGSVYTGFCDCRASRKSESCAHFSRLVQLASEMRKRNGGREWGELFAGSLWLRLAQIFSDGGGTLCTDARVTVSRQDNSYAFCTPGGTLLGRLFGGAGKSCLRFLERAGKLPKPTRFQDRDDLIRRIAACLRSEEEKKINEAGVLTNRQTAEQSFWGRLAYHCFREYGDECCFHPAIEQGSGDFVLKCASRENDPVCELTVPRRQVRKVLALLSAEFPKQSDLAIHPVPLRSIFLVSENTKLDLEVRPMIQALQVSGEKKFFDGKNFEKFRYGDLVYLPEMNLLAELEVPGSGRKFVSPVSMRLELSKLPAFLDEHRHDLDDGFLMLDDPLSYLSVLREYDKVEIVPEALKRSWYWLSVRYGFGDDSVSLAEVLRARREGEGYLQIGHGWVDVNAPAFAALDLIDRRKDLIFTGDKVRLSAVDLLRLMSSTAKAVTIKDDDRRAEIVRRLLTLSPAAPMDRLKGMITSLRAYQLKGVDWLRFLYENGLSGLLCDDMGLGKTHQAMALMVWLKEGQNVKEPFLVICPTTVISHWINKIREHSPGLKATAYHGDQRDLDAALSDSTVLVTSYGILRNDIGKLSAATFSLAVFDEIQNLKNRETLSYQAACAIQARMRIGLTGTPIENSLTDLKSLFDLVLPGYLGGDEEFAARYIEDRDGCNPPPAAPELRKLISPLILRRLKSSVLQELPEKMEDLRICELTEAQVKLYRDALSMKGTELLNQLRSNASQLPYIHVFALLNVLKRICDHPALVLNKVDEYQKYESGKWNLFQELLFECLDNGQKVVVFAQYLGMIAMMERLLSDLGIGFVTLTGASVERGDIVRRFNEEASCRVFLGSLKAGGAGIDLVGGSVVIHYDRWWNAAREDQATDRVHRIGQKRAVQVFKLVTAGTLEEKIAAIIDRKRQLMNSVIQADDPHLSKIFTREELIDLLRPV